MKYWEIIADNLSKAKVGSWGCVSTADEKLTAFVELELAICRGNH